MNQAEKETDVCQSQAIEGIRFDMASSLSKAHIAAADLAWELATNNQWPDVCRLHSVMMSPSDLELPELGQWRTVSASFGSLRNSDDHRHMPKASALSGLMHEWERICRSYLARVDEPESDRELMAEHLYYHFLCIHPFADGNGRVGRLMRSAMRVILGLSWGTITTYKHPSHVRKLINYEDKVFRPRYTELY
jgi:hypothetical protein